MPEKPPLSLGILTCCAFVEERALYTEIRMPLTSLYLKNKKTRGQSMKAIPDLLRDQKSAFVPILTNLCVDIILSLKV